MGKERSDEPVRNRKALFPGGSLSAQKKVGSSETEGCRSHLFQFHSVPVAAGHSIFNDINWWERAILETVDFILSCSSPCTLLQCPLSAAQLLGKVQK